MTNETNDKFAAMVGFARRAGKIVYGYDELKRDRKCRLLAVGAGETGNILSNMMAIAARRGAMLVAVEDMGELVGGNCKAFGISDANMAKAMADYVGGNPPRYKAIATTEV